MADFSEPSQATPAKHFTALLVVWLGAQLLAIGLAAARIPLWAGTPQAMELLALQYLLIAQISVGSLIFPWLMRSAASTVVVVATAWPMIFFAGLLSPAPLTTLVITGIYVSGWLVALAILRPPLSSTSLSPATPAVGLWACGGPILQFLNLEYGGTPLQDGIFQRVALGPIVAGIRLIQGELAASCEVLAAALLACVILAIARLLQRRRRSRGNLGRP